MAAEKARKFLLLAGNQLHAVGVGGVKSQVFQNRNNVDTSSSYQLRAQTCNDSHIIKRSEINLKHGNTVYLQHAVLDYGTKICGSFSWNRTRYRAIVQG